MQPDDQRRIKETRDQLGEIAITAMNLAEDLYGRDVVADDRETFELGGFTLHFSLKCGCGGATGGGDSPGAGPGGAMATTITRRCAAHPTDQHDIALLAAFLEGWLKFNGIPL